MLVLLDNGHGSLINGVYQTPGKRIDWEDKGIIYEGEFNRAIVNGIIEHLSYPITLKCFPYPATARFYRVVNNKNNNKCDSFSTCFLSFIWYAKGLASQKLRFSASAGGNFYQSFKW